ncbi:MAG TPA: NAD(P)-dependent oxidoreductase [Thermoanaerobaculia bacterium]|jgi:D-3-phosphoglycerate dehydrogenase|nr:NAD(P)-dependent oxidoreductase [Thermoanaerobaculia bacterium]
MKILIGPSTFGDVDPSPLRRLAAAGCEVVPNPYRRKLTSSELLELLPGVTGLIAGLEPLTRDVLERSNLQVISRSGAGVSNVDCDAARELGIKVFTTPDAPTSAVAELTVGVMLALLRRVPQMDRDLHEGKWSKQIGLQLEGKNVVIVGFGRIGRCVAALLRAFGANLFAVDPQLSGDVDGVRVLPIDEALRRADIITLHASGEHEILGAREFDLLKRGVFILNAGRGGLVNEALLCRALDEGKVAGGWIDTFETEPYEGPLTRYAQLILTPHVGSASAECRLRMENEAVDNLLRGLGVERR